MVLYRSILYYIISCFCVFSPPQRPQAARDGTPDGDPDGDNYPVTRVY